MGQVRKPKYNYIMSGFTRLNPQCSCWKGRIPTVQQLEKFVMEYVVSTMPGYCNERIGMAYGIEIPSTAQVRMNDGSNRVLVEWKMPMFQVLPDPKDYPKVARALTTSNSARVRIA